MAIASLDRLLDLQALQAEAGRRSLKRFTKDVWHLVEPGTPFVDGWVIDCLCEHLEAITFGQLRKIVINIPPRHTKSTLISVIWPVWNWLHIPEDRFLVASYSLDLSTRDNRRKRNMIEDDWFQARYGKHFHITSDQNTKRFFENNVKGYQMAVSVDGATTGHGGSKLVLDDPHSAADAYSDADCDAALRWFREVWTNRLNNQKKDCMVTVGQRIRENDVCGYILKERPDWTHLNLPAEYEPSRKCFTSIGWSDPRTVEGELLWPERFSREVLGGLKRDLGSMGYASQYQQSPVPSEGGQFKEKWFRYFSTEGEYYRLKTPEGIKSVKTADCWRFSVVDLAISTRQSADYTVIQTYDVTPQNDLLLIDQQRGHFDNPEQQRQIRLVYFRFKPRFMQIEAVAYQLAIIQQLRDEPVETPIASPVQVGDFLVRVGGPEALNSTLRGLPNVNAFVVQDSEGRYATYGGYYLVRVEGDIYFFRYACEQQGYCQIAGDVTPDIMQQITQQNKQRYSIPIKEYKPVRDKVSRASAPSILMEQGKFYFSETLTDLPVIKLEFLRFPKGEHDDIVDCGSQAAEVIFVPAGPVMWSPDTLDAPPVPTPAHFVQVEHPVRSVFEVEEEFIEQGEWIELEMGGHSRW